MRASAAALVLTAVTAGVILVLALVLGTCGPASDNISREPLTIVAANGTTARLQVEIARTAAERQTGLMDRTELATNTGMLFVIEPPGRGFWMKDTRIKLTVAFIAECGRILAFADLEPLSEEIKNTTLDYRFGLEVDRGWFDCNGIAIGDTVILPRDVRPAGC